MSDSPTNEELQQAARQRMERWLLSPDLREFMQFAQDVPRRPVRTRPYIAISREAGLGGGHIARLVGNRLGWDVLDKELLDFITQRYDMPRNMLEIVDETKANWFYDVLGTFFDSRIVSQDNYVVHLERILYLAALHGKIVFVGRGAHFVLPTEQGLSVRLVAPKQYRVEQLMQQQHLSRQEATRTVDEVDAGRRNFCQRYFRRNVEDAHLYDMVLNVARLAPEAVTQLIVDAYHSRVGQSQQGSVVE